MICRIDELLAPPDVYGSSWCVIDLSHDKGFHVPYGSDAHIHLVIEGAVRVTSADGQSFDLVAGDVAVQISGDFHKLQCGPSPSNQPLEELATDLVGSTPFYAEVGFGDRACRLLSGRLKIRWPGGADHHRLSGMLLLDRKDVAIDIAKLFELTTAAGATAVLNHAAGVLLTGALRGTASSEGDPGRDGHDPILRAKMLIERHPFASWSVRTLAERVGMTRGRFAARFLAETGRTPAVALQEERMKHAMMFLRHTNLEIGEVSERVGCPSESAFVRQFAEHFHITPSKLRKQAMYRVQ